MASFSEAYAWLLRNRGLAGTLAMSGALTGSIVTIRFAEGTAGLAAPASWGLIGLGAVLGVALAAALVWIGSYGTVAVLCTSVVAFTTWWLSANGAIPPEFLEWRTIKFDPPFKGIAKQISGDVVAVVWGFPGLYFAATYLARIQSGAALLQRFNSPEMYALRRRAYSEAIAYRSGDRAVLVRCAEPFGSSYYSAPSTLTDGSTAVSQVLGFVLELERSRQHRLVKRRDVMRLLRPRLAWFVALFYELDRDYQAWATEVERRSASTSRPLTRHEYQFERGWIFLVDSLRLGDQLDSDPLPNALKASDIEDLLSIRASTLAMPVRFDGCSTAEWAECTCVISSFGKTREEAEYALAVILGPVPPHRGWTRLWERRARHGYPTWIREIGLRKPAGRWERVVTSLDRAGATACFLRLWEQGLSQDPDYCGVLMQLVGHPREE